MNTTKSLTELTNEILTARMSIAKKAEALIKLGVTPYEANILARAAMPATARTPQAIFTYTFGVEIECYNCNPHAFVDRANRNGLVVLNQLAHYNHTDIPQFKLVSDGSLSGNNTAECVTPALNSTDGFESLQACCRSLDEIGARTNKSCGLHVHIGAASLTDREFCNVFVNYMRLEMAIESFMAPSRRGCDARWCYSLRRHEGRVLAATTKSEMRQALNYDRYHRVNAEAYNRHSTIEFRQHQGTTNFTKISRWVKFLGKLVEYSKTNRLTENVDRIEDIPFLTQAEKNWFIGRRGEFEARSRRNAA